MINSLADISLATLGGGSLLALFGAMLVVAIICIAAIYVYTSLALMTIGKKLAYKKSWLAWIPIANYSMILQMGSFHWAWVFLVLIPVLGWIALGALAVISMWRIFEKRKYPGWLALVPVAAVIPMIGGLAGIAFLVILGLVAWKNR
jgi:hypothetical protein